MGQLQTRSIATNPALAANPERTRWHPSS